MPSGEEWPGEVVGKERRVLWVGDGEGDREEFRVGTVLRIRVKIADAL